MKNQPYVTFNSSGTEESVKQATRKYSAANALIRINQETALLLSGKYDNDIFRSVRQVSIYYLGRKRQKKSTNIWITGWALLDLAYQIIKFSNDYRGRILDNDQELAILVQLSQSYFEKREHAWIADKKYEESFLLYVYGFMGEQMKYQSTAKCLDNAGRELFILFDLAPQAENKINVAEIVKKETGMEWETVLTLLFLAWFVSTQSPYVLEIESIFDWTASFSYKDYCSLIDRYTASYQEIRDDDKGLGRQQLAIKPFVKTQKGSIISVNAFQNLFLYEHSIFWIVRDYYQKLNSEEFTRCFGEYFELYFESLLEQYVAKGLFEELIPNDHQKRADWKMELHGYRFLVEQKSSILSLFAKQQESDVKKTISFCENYVLKAMRQLHKTEEEFNDGKYIKIILLYEDYLKAEILDEVFKFPSCDIEDDNYYWLMSINEMEGFLKLNHDNPEVFINLIKEKITRETTKSNDGRSLEQLLSKFGVGRNYHLTQEKFLNYRDMARKNIERLIKPDNTIH